ncbi:unnamed protein product [Staurois parvus]|uniref:Uncharacterized protein n=1 Tax=Staurois parvus TaxID=386267 RepID=A0ABN9HE63_9NEOB|nr:unnamed protein product [Staurois parvus]
MQGPGFSNRLYCILCCGRPDIVNAGPITDIVNAGSGETRYCECRPGSGGDQI